MSLYTDWRGDIDAHSNSREEQQQYWEDFCLAEQKVYQKILKERTPVIEGTLSALAETYGMTPLWFMGFMDGVSDSVNESLGDLETYTPDSPVKIDIDFEKLYLNMLKVPAEWLYKLDEWDGVLSAERRDTIEKDYKRPKTIVKGPKIGRNDPCPCGSGKKYKKCCGRNQ